MSLLLHPLTHFERVGNVYLYLLIHSVEFGCYTSLKVFLIFFKVFPSFLSLFCSFPFKCVCTKVIGTSGMHLEDIFWQWIFMFDLPLQVFRKH